MHFCRNCDTGILNKIPADEPWNPQYYHCPNCDSTFVLEQIEDDDIDAEDQRGTEMSAYMNVNLRGN